MPPNNPPCKWIIVSALDFKVFSKARFIYFVADTVQSLWFTQITLKKTNKPKSICKTTIFIDNAKNWSACCIPQYFFGVFSINRISLQLFSMQQYFLGNIKKKMLSYPYIYSVRIWR